MSALGLLNFAVLQWFGVRIYCGWNGGDHDFSLPRGRWWSPHAPPRGVKVVWAACYWIVPLTGWWSSYRWVGKHRTRTVGVSRTTVKQ